MGRYPTTPPPTHEQRVSSAGYQREQWLTKAGLTIGPLQDAVDLDIATEEERTRLTEWKQFRVAVYRIAPTLAPDIDWPEPPRGFE
nr:putative phage tail assembly protein [Serratia symbiotica]